MNFDYERICDEKSLSDKYDVLLQEAERIYSANKSKINQWRAKLSVLTKK